MSHRWSWEEVSWPLVTWQERWALWKLPDLAFLTGPRCWVSSRWAWQGIHDCARLFRVTKPPQTGWNPVCLRKVHCVCVGQRLPAHVLSAWKERNVELMIPREWLNAGGFLGVWDPHTKHKELKCACVCIWRSVYAASMWRGSAEGLMMWVGIVSSALSWDKVRGTHSSHAVCNPCSHGSMGASGVMSFWSGARVCRVGSGLLP